MCACVALAVQLIRSPTVPLQLLVDAMPAQCPIARSS